MIPPTLVREAYEVDKATFYLLSALPLHAHEAALAEVEHRTEVFRKAVTCSPRPVALHVRLEAIRSVTTDVLHGRFG